MCTLDDDGEYRVGPGGRLVHQRLAHRTVLLPRLHHMIDLYWTESAHFTIILSQYFTSNIFDNKGSQVFHVHTRLGVLFQF